MPYDDDDDENAGFEDDLYGFETRYSSPRDPLTLTTTTAAMQRRRRAIRTSSTATTR
jgi:hypothetical protein